MIVVVATSNNGGNIGIRSIAGSRSDSGSGSSSCGGFGSCSGLVV